MLPSSNFCIKLFVRIDTLYELSNICGEDNSYNLYKVTILSIVDESLSKRVMCLLAELYFCTSQPERAISIINSLEKNLFSKKESEEADGSLTDKVVEAWKLKLALVITISRS